MQPPSICRNVLYFPGKHGPHHRPEGHAAIITDVVTANGLTTVNLAVFFATGEYEPRQNIKHKSDLITDDTPYWDWPPRVDPQRVGPPTPRTDESLTATEPPLDPNIDIPEPEESAESVFAKEAPDAVQLMEGVTITDEGLVYINLNPAPPNWPGALRAQQAIVTNGHLIMAVNELNDQQRAALGMNVAPPKPEG